MNQHWPIVDEGPLRTCITCNNSGTGPVSAWHPYQHPFKDASAGRPEAPQTTNTPEPMPAYPFDPVLRQALIDKGVITPWDLKEAQAKIEVMTGVFQKELKREVDDDD